MKINNYHHIPVLLDQVIKYLNPQSGQNFIDCTLGGGGYTLKIYERTKRNSIKNEKVLPRLQYYPKNSQILAIDLDKMAIENFEKISKEKNLKNIILHQDNFINLQEIVNKYFEQGFKFDGIVMDLGMSSAQLNDQNRGVSFKNLNAPLNMSFGKDTNKTQEIINNYSEQELIKIFKEYGEERFSKKIAQKIVENRKISQISKVGELIKIISQAVSIRFQNQKIHFATRVFQALRIETNNELENLKKVLPQAIDLLKKKGRLVIVSFHSLEDRIVKQYFKQESKDCLCLSEFPICQCNHQVSIKIITKKPLIPSLDEIKKNPRSRSAKMRVIEKFN